MTRKYKLDRSGLNYRVGSPEHKSHQRVVTVREGAEAVFGMVMVCVLIYGLSWAGYIFELQ